MHNILITQKVFIDKHKQINWSLEDSWFKFFGQKKSGKRVMIRECDFNHFFLFWVTVSLRS